MNTLFVVGDIHGEYALLQEMLTHWHEEEALLVFVGDLIDRGPQSKACLLLAQSLVQAGKAVYVLGNHEDIFLQWLDDPEEKYDWYRRNGGEATICSLLHEGATVEYSPTEMALMIKRRYADLVQFLAGLPLYYETPQYLVVHAGVNLTLADWRETSRRDFIWIREPFHDGENHTGKTIIFGHTPTMSLFGEMGVDALWQRDNKIGIDGGAVYEGVLHGIVLTPEGMTAHYVVPHPNFKKRMEKSDGSNRTTGL